MLWKYGNSFTPVLLITSFLLFTASYPISVNATNYTISFYKSNNLTMIEGNWYTITDDYGVVYKLFPEPNGGQNHEIIRNMGLYMGVPSGNNYDIVNTSIINDNVNITAYSVNVYSTGGGLLYLWINNPLDSYTLSTGWNYIEPTVKKWSLFKSSRCYINECGFAELVKNPATEAIIKEIVITTDEQPPLPPQPAYINLDKYNYSIGEDINASIGFNNSNAKVQIQAYNTTTGQLEALDTMSFINYFPGTLATGSQTFPTTSYKNWNYYLPDHWGEYNLYRAALYNGLDYSLLTYAYFNISEGLPIPPPTPTATVNPFPTPIPTVNQTPVATVNQSTGSTQMSSNLTSLRNITGTGKAIAISNLTNLVTYINNVSSQLTNYNYTSQKNLLALFFPVFATIPTKVYTIGILFWIFLIILIILGR